MTQNTKWSLSGALVGACFALITQAPASWLANLIGKASQNRFVLQNTQGTVLRGSAIALLADGKFGMPLSTRLHWDFSTGFDTPLMRPVLRGQIKSECCTPEPLQFAISLGWQGVRMDFANQTSQWPVRWLVGLGSPWNTVQPEGRMHLRTENLRWKADAGGPKFEGSAELTLSQLATPLSTLRPLGTYRLRVQGGDTMAVTLATLEGGLQLSGNGQWINGGLRFRGEARAQPAFEAALSNLLNILGQRQGDISKMELG